MSRAVRIINALLLIAVFGILVASFALPGMRGRHQRALDQRFSDALGPYTDDGWYKRNMTDQWVKRDFRVLGAPPIANPQFKYMAVASKRFRNYQALFSDGLADLVIEVIVSPDGSMTAPSAGGWEIVLIHYDGRPEKITSSVALRDELKREVLQCADEMADALRKVHR